MLVSITVRTVQQGLYVFAHETDGSFHPGTVDGVWGPRTRLALMRFQTYQGRGNLNAGLSSFSDGVSGILVDSSIAADLNGAARDYAATVGGGPGRDTVQNQNVATIDQMREQTATAMLLPPRSSGESTRWMALLLGLGAAAALAGGYYYVTRRKRRRR